MITMKTGSTVDSTLITRIQNSSPQLMLYSPRKSSDNSVIKNNLHFKAVMAYRILQLKNLRLRCLILLRFKVFLMINSPNNNSSFMDRPLVIIIQQVANPKEVPLSPTVATKKQSQSRSNKFKCINNKKFKTQQPYTNRIMMTMSTILRMMKRIIKDSPDNSNNNKEGIKMEE